jgi:hypothetical protein
MKEGTKIVDHLNVFNTLICQLSSMDVTYEDEDKEVTLLCSLPESWDHLVTTMWFSSTYAIDYDTVVGALLSEEMRKDPVRKPQQQKQWWSEVDLQKEGKIRKVQPGLSQKTVRVRENVGSVENLGISRRIVGKDNKHPKRTPQKKQIQLQVWLMKFCLSVVSHHLCSHRRCRVVMVESP